MVAIAIILLSLSWQRYNIHGDDDYDECLCCGLHPLPAPFSLSLPGALIQELSLSLELELSIELSIEICLPTVAWLEELLLGLSLALKLSI